MWIDEGILKKILIDKIILDDGFYIDETKWKPYQTNCSIKHFFFIYKRKFYFVSDLLNHDNHNSRNSSTWKTGNRAKCPEIMPSEWRII